jgi:hypothetical protein
MSSWENQRAPLSEPAAEAAVIALERLHALLLRAGAGEVGAQDLVRGLKDFWAAHGSVIRAASRALANEVRRQALVELYKWQAQLAQQLQSRQTLGN